METVTVAAEPRAAGRAPGPPDGPDRPGRPAGAVGIAVVAVLAMVVGGLAVLRGGEPSRAVVAADAPTEPSISVTELSVPPGPDSIVARAPSGPAPVAAGAAPASATAGGAASAGVAAGDRSSGGGAPDGSASVDSPSRPGVPPGSARDPEAAPPEPATPPIAPALPTATGDAVLPMFEPAEAGPDEAVYAVVGSGRVVVRSEPRRGSDPVAVLPDAATGVPVDGRDEDWLAVRGAAGGWVDASALVVQHGDAPAGIHARALAVAAALRAGDHPALAALVHPGRGVLVSPDAFVDAEDVVLAASEVARDDGTVRTWGRHDGTLDPIERTVSAQLAELGRLGALASPDAVGFDVPVGQGSSVDNLAGSFPDAHLVELHDAGSDVYGGFDWTSLRMAFVPDTTGTWWLVALTQDNWTI